MCFKWFEYHLVHIFEYNLAFMKVFRMQSSWFSPVSTWSYPNPGDMVDIDISPIGQHDFDMFAKVS